MGAALCGGITLGCLHSYDLLGHVSGYDDRAALAKPVNGCAAWVVTGMEAGDGLFDFLVCVGRLEPALSPKGEKIIL